MGFVLLTQKGKKWSEIEWGGLNQDERHKSWPLRAENTELYLYYYDSNVLELMGVSLINVAVAHS